MTTTKGYTKAHEDRALDRLAKDIRQAPEAKHTPGPWNVSGLPDTYRRDCINANGPRPVAEVPRHNPDWQANARLIAAAPDLLEACKFLIARSGTMGPEDAAYAECSWEAIGKIEAAIAKAEGGAG